MNSWLFQGNPKFYKISPALRHFAHSKTPTTWLVNKHQKDIHSGDEVFFWEAGRKAGLVGWGTVISEPTELPLEPEEAQFVVERSMFDGARLRVRITVEGQCLLRRIELRGNSVLSKWSAVARGVQGTNFAIPNDILSELHKVTGRPR